MKAPWCLTSMKVLLAQLAWQRAAFQQKKTVARFDKIHRLIRDHKLAESRCCIQDPAASSSAAPTAVINLQQTFNGQQMMSLTQRTVATQTELVINP